MVHRVYYHILLKLCGFPSFFLCRLGYEGHCCGDWMYCSIIHSPCWRVQPLHISMFCLDVVLFIFLPQKDDKQTSFPKVVPDLSTHSQRVWACISHALWDSDACIHCNSTFFLFACISFFLFAGASYWNCEVRLTPTLFFFEAFQFQFHFLILFH